MWVWVGMIAVALAGMCCVDRYSINELTDKINQQQKDISSLTYRLDATKNELTASLNAIHSRSDDYRVSEHSCVLIAQGERITDFEERIRALSAENEKLLTKLQTSVCKLSANNTSTQEQLSELRVAVCVLFAACAVCFLLVVCWAMDVQKAFANHRTCIHNIVGDYYGLTNRVNNLETRINDIEGDDESDDEGVHDDNDGDKTATAASAAKPSSQPVVTLAAPARQWWND